MVGRDGGSVSGMQDDLMEDEALMARLGVALAAVDPVPEHVLAVSRAVFTLRRMDAELADLVRDSADQLGGVLAVRGAGDVRLISFETGPVVVEMQVTERGAVRDLIAAIGGAAVVAVEVETPAGRGPATVEDTVAVAGDIPAGLVRLHVDTADGRTLVTSWVRV